MTKNKKQPKCISAEEWVIKLRYIYTVEHCKAVKSNVLFVYKTNWVSPTDVVLSERSQIREYILLDYSFLKREIRAKLSMIEITIVVTLRALNMGYRGAFQSSKTMFSILICYKHMSKFTELSTHKVCELKHNRKKIGRRFH